MSDPVLRTEEDIESMRKWHILTIPHMQNFGAPRDHGDCDMRPRNTFNEDMGKLRSALFPDDPVRGDPEPYARGFVVPECTHSINEFDMKKKKKSAPTTTTNSMQNFFSESRLQHTQSDTGSDVQEDVKPSSSTSLFGSSLFGPPAGELFVGGAPKVEAPPVTRISLENNLIDLQNKNVQYMNMHERIKHESDIHTLRLRIQDMEQDFRIKDILEAISPDSGDLMAMVTKNLGNATSTEIGTLHTMLRCSKDGPKSVLDILGKDYSYDYRA